MQTGTACHMLCLLASNTWSKLLLQPVELILGAWFQDFVSGLCVTTVRLAAAHLC